MIRQFVLYAALLGTAAPAFAQSAPGDVLDNPFGDLPVVETVQETVQPEAMPETVRQPVRITVPNTSLAVAPSADELAAQDYCISVMSSFPNDDMVARYQFFRLTQELARDTSPEFSAALVEFADGAVDPSTPVLDVIDTIANPVIRQAAPGITVANMGHLVAFADVCSTYLDGQVEALRAYDDTLVYGDPVIVEDVLFLRQILSESVRTLDAEGRYTATLDAYDRSLVLTRDEAEFTEFDLAVADLEGAFMADLDGKLARSNDLINSEMDREALYDGIVLAETLNEQAAIRAKRENMFTLIRILAAY